MENIKLNFEELKTEEEKNQAIEFLRTGTQSPFWKYLKNVLNFNIEAITEKILSGVEMGEKENAVYKLYLQALKELKNAPKKHLLFLKNKDDDNIEDDNPDPHY